MILSTEPSLIAAHTADINKTGRYLTVRIGGNVSATGAA